MYDGEWLDDKKQGSGKLEEKFDDYTFTYDSEWNDDNPKLIFF